MEREVGGGIGMGNTCKPMAVSFQCMTKFTTNKKINKKKNKESYHKSETNPKVWRKCYHQCFDNFEYIFIFIVYIIDVLKEYCNIFS